MSSVTNYLDLYNFFVNEIVGSFPLFIILGVVFIVFLGARERLDFQSILLLCFVYIGGLVGVVYNDLAWTFIVLIVGLIFYVGLSNLFRR